APNVLAILRRRAENCQDADLPKGRTGAQQMTDLQNGALERAAGLETRHAARGNLDGLARPRVATVALGAPADEEGAEAADGHLPTTAEGVGDVAEERVQRALGGDLGSARRLRHRRHQIRLRHGSFYLRESGGDSQEAPES